jgi:DNA-binding NtrC family response regulator
MVEPERQEVELADLPPKVRDAARAAGGFKADPLSGAAADIGDAGFYEKVGAFESSLLRAEYAKSEGNVSQLALRLGMDRSHLHAKLKEYGIHTARPKSK